MRDCPLQKKTPLTVASLSFPKTIMLPNAFFTILSRRWKKPVEKKIKSQFYVDLSTPHAGKDVLSFFFLLN